MLLEPVGFSAPVQFFEPRELARVGRHDDLAAAFMRDAVLRAKAIHRFAAFNAIARLHRAGLVVKAGMDDAAVMPGLVGGEAVFRLEEDLRNQAGR